ncbi:uncharacterized protein BXZ73DRAFT_81106 [Epithele typhae]|uniref:uncharacterized protein n=1 Tax=Epithele typhae TaxID=378194 RepID=UPI002007FA16|nr:uncharacterized protein BXZ73DRAFT_81106 [Epithele typhae]KAH9916424.1 hypothetical protein BXZ73DRAFT_81106 [Epithele typhae]
MAHPPRPGPGQRPLVATEGISDDVLANSITISRPSRMLQALSGPSPSSAASSPLHSESRRPSSNRERTQTRSSLSLSARPPSPSHLAGATQSPIGMQRSGEGARRSQRELEKGRFNRFFRRAKLHGKAQECLLKLDDAWRSFDTAILVRLERQVESLKSQVESQAPFEPGSLVPYVPFTSIQKDRTTTQYRTRTHNGEQRSGIWDNRPVTVRMYDHKFKDNVFESIQMYSENQYALIFSQSDQESHETLSNVIAMARPQAGTQFYVLEGVRRSILADFGNKDPVVWVRKLYQHAHRDHRQHFLPEAPVLHNSGFNFDALVQARDHLSHSNFSRLWDFVARQIIPLNSLEIADNDAKPGDYGYITNHPDGPRFAYLGNIDDVFESSVDIDPVKALNLVKQRSREVRIVQPSV